MKTGKKPILWSLLALAVTYLMFVPGLNFIALLLMLVPYTVLYTLLDRKSWAIHILAVLVIGSVINGSLAFLSISLLAIIPSIYLGKYYKQGLPSVKIIPKVTAIVILVMMIGLFLLESAAGFSFTGDIRKYMTLTYNDLSSQGLAGLNLTPEMMDQFITLMLRMIPLVFFIMSLIIVACSHAVARRVVSAEGIEVIPYPQAKDWRLPRALIWLYLVAYIMELTMDPTDGSFLTLAIFNLVPALSLMFSIQAVGLLFFIADRFRLPKVLPILLAIPLLLFPLSSVIGLLDVAFPIRKKISKQQ